MLFKYLFILMAGLFMLLTSSCGEEPSPSNSRKTAPPPDELRIPFNGIVKSIDPGLDLFETNQVELVEQLFLGLTTLKKDSYEIVPRLAKKWDTNEDGTIYTFSLRSDAKWTDGKPVTAHDVVWTIQRNFRLYIRTYGYQNSAFGMLKNAQLNQAKLEKDENADISSLGVRALDDYTVEFILKYPLSFFPALMSYAAYRPIPSHIIEKYGNQWTKPAHIQSNGPYQLIKWKDDEILLAKNINYYDANQVKIAKVHYYTVRQSSVGLAMYEQNQLDIIGGANYLRLPDTELPRLKFDMVLSKELRGGYQARTEWYGFNTQRSPTNDLQVRKAIAAAIDKQLLIDVVLKGNHIPAKTFTLANLLDIPEQKEKRCPKETSQFGVPFCPEQAKNDWEQARQKLDENKTFPQMILLHNISEIHSTMGKGIQTLLKHYLKIEVEVKALPYYSYLDAIKPTKDTPHIFRAGWFADYPEAYLWLEAFHPQDGYYNWLLHGNEHEKEFSEIMNQVLQISDQRERKQLYRRAEEILTHQAVVMIPIFFYNSPVLVKPRVKGWYNMACGGQHIHNWSLEP